MVPNNKSENNIPTHDQFVKGVIARARHQRSKITFYIGNQAVSVEHDSTTQYLTFTSEEQCITFRVAFPGVEADDYIVRRVKEVFQKQSQYFPEEGEPICC